MSISRLAYTSEAHHTFSKRELLDLLHDARDLNAADGITGLLIHAHGQFLQILEGSPEALDDLLGRLARDPRHTRPTVILDTVAEERVFPDWAMGALNLDDPHLSMLPGVRVDIAGTEARNDLLTHLPELRDALTDILD